MRILERRNGKEATFMVALLLLVSISYLGFAELTRVYVEVNMDNSPIEITSFGQYRYEDSSHISSVVGFVNNSERAIEALAITMIYYDPFNDREDGVRGIFTDILDAHQGGSGTWSTYGTPGFVKTAMAFVSAVRFVDGEVWKANPADVVARAERIPELSFLSQTEMIEIGK